MLFVDRFDFDQWSRNFYYQNYFEIYLLYKKRIFDLFEDNLGNLKFGRYIEDVIIFFLVKKYDFIVKIILL